MTLAILIILSYAITYFLMRKFHEYDKNAPPFVVYVVSLIPFVNVVLWAFAVSGEMSASDDNTFKNLAEKIKNLITGNDGK